ncbi:MAG: protein kinase [Cytophagales bacterium]|nr:protein kinase [Cytophagales bacterium]
MAILIKSPELPFAGGTVTWWEKETGEAVQFGDVLVEIRGSGGEDYPVKAILPGTVLHVFAKAGTEVPPDAPLAIVGEPGEDIGPWLNLAQNVPQPTAEVPATQSGFTVATGGETAGSSFTVAADAQTNFGNVANDAANMDSGGSSFTSATEVEPPSFVASGNLTTEQAQNLKTYGRGFDKFVKMRPVPQQGAMGELFFATQVLSGRDVVVKRLKPERRADAKSREYFMREINLGTVLPYHRNIINIFYSDENEHGPYYVMERVNGQSLQHFIDKQPLPANKLRDIFLGILDGLRHIHTHLMVHRDLKPMNILLDTQHWIPKIIDFGFAKHPSYPDIDVTDIGTGGYMAPEQRGDQQDVDARADIYAVGCVFYAMITREHPHTIDVDKITGPLQAVIARCAESNPADRFQSVQEIMDALTQKTQGSGFSVKKAETGGVARQPAVVETDAATAAKTSRSRRAGYPETGKRPERLY